RGLFELLVQPYQRRGPLPPAGGVGALRGVSGHMQSHGQEARHPAGSCDRGVERLPARRQ
ncbi:unnamed protein product, partial [Prorocentrum cordatum]